MFSLYNFLIDILERKATSLEGMRRTQKNQVENTKQTLVWKTVYSDQSYFCMTI